MNSIGPQRKPGAELVPTGVRVLSTDPAEREADMLLSGVPDNLGVTVADLLDHYYDAWLELPKKLRPKESASSRIYAMQNSGALIVKGTVVSRPQPE